MTEPNTFIWNELVTPDQASAGPFYSTLFGWERHEVDAGPLGTYTLFRHGGDDVGGMMNPTARDYAGSPPPRWISYIAVADADATAARVHELGGKGRHTTSQASAGSPCSPIRPERSCT